MSRPWIPKSRAAAFVWIVAGYLAGGLAGWAAAAALDGAPAWQRVAAADLAATLVVFVFSVLFDNSSFYDPYWSVAPIPIVIWLGLDASAPFARRLAVIVLVTAWGLRLTWNWARGWAGFHHEDWRYVDYREKTGKGYWFVSLFGLHLMPTITVGLGMLSFLPSLSAGRALGPLDALGALITGTAIYLEATADAQLRAFRKKKQPAGVICTEGLWAYCRHPNYLGEVTFWWGLFVFGLAANPSAWWWTLPGPLWITTMFLSISIPLIDRRSIARRPGYADHIKRIPALFPVRLGKH